MRQIWFGIQLALDTLQGHKLRAFLTVLGVIIGTSTVIGVGSIIAGLDGAITNQLKSFGTNNLVVTKWDSLIGFGGRSLEERLRKPLTYENAVAINERCPSVASVSPWLFAPWNMIHKGKYKGVDAFNLNLGGTDPGYVESGVEMVHGRFFTESENLRRLPVVVLGEDLGKSWFQNADPVGKSVEIDGHIFEVVGVMKRPTASMPGQEDRRALFPYFSMRKMFPNAREHMLIVVAHEGRQAAAIDEVRAVLRIERRLPYDKPDSFAISTAEQMIDQFRGVIAMVALVMVVMSSIGLLVGGIGVMNIMLVSVTERTREIGTRKALGARRIDIVTQFLTEAVVLTFLGGLMGMGVGWLISQGVALVFPTLPTAVPMWAVMAGLGVSVGVGLFFGIWPASKAARLDPVVALRYE
ncbi:MAG: multidrug ABC transporter substrate-binding protein [Acidobacteriia bacterium 12-62-4]|nr:MAG: multidrug ABC transporter substrate-binding protein [Acidobacteriia bacterium 12-62-4]